MCQGTSAALLSSPGALQFRRMAHGSPPSAPLLEVRELSTGFALPSGLIRAVDQVSFAIEPGETLGIVGESGSGKSVTALSIMRLVQPPGRILGGSITFEGQNLLALTERQMCGVRGARLSLIFQEPMTALN